MKGSRRWSSVGLVMGVLLGAALLAVGRSAAGPTGTLQPDAGTPEIDVVHRSPLLVLPGEAAALDYEVVCPTADPNASCLGAGDVFVRRAGAESYTRLPLERQAGGVLRATLPAAFSNTGFAYYARIHEETTGATRTLPPGGADGPHRVWVMRNLMTVKLGTHAFGHTRAPDAIVARGAWGSGRDQFGLDDGSEQARVGVGSFDVAADGSVVVLDQINGRITTFFPGVGTRQVPVSLAGGLGDLALAPDGRMVVVETGGPGARTPAIRLLAPNGRQIAAGQLAERTSGQVRWSPAGAVVQQTPSDAWMQATEGTASVLTVAEQGLTARVGRLVDAAEIDALVKGVADPEVELVVDALSNDTRYALVSNDEALFGWRVLSDTTLGEVQLVEPHRDGLLVVQRVWTDRVAEFRVLHLTALGVKRRFAVQALEWAETSPLSQFRYANGSLYQLRSTETGAEIARFSVGGE